LDLQNRVKALESGNIGSTSVSLSTQMVTKPAPIAPSMPTTAQKITPQELPVQTSVAPVAKPSSAEEEFTPPPISKKASGNDINSLWQMLLMNIKVPSTTALLKLATPLQISPEGIVLTFKNDRLVAQISDTNKKQLIVDAANIMFNQESTPVTVRLAQAGDKQVSTPVEVIQTEPAPRQPQQQLKQTQTQTIQATQKTGQPKQAQDLQNVKTELSKEDIEHLESDQEKMIIELFDGKYVK
jgi:hypothetical protein